MGVFVQDTLSKTKWTCGGKNVSKVEYGTFKGALCVCVVIVWPCVTLVSFDLAGFTAELSLYLS